MNNLSNEGQSVFVTRNATDEFSDICNRLELRKNVNNPIDLIYLRNTIGEKLGLPPIRLINRDPQKKATIKLVDKQFQIRYFAYDSGRHGRVMWFILNIHIQKTGLS